MTQRILILLLLWFALLASLAGRADDFETDMGGTAGSLRVWHVMDGLPSDAVTAILQPRDGFLWIGTTAGLVRFDGVKFTQIKATDSATNDLTGITALCEDGSGHLWIGTQDHGVFELAQGQLQHFTPARGLANQNVTSLAADGQGQVWIGSNSGLSLWTGQRFVTFTKRDGLPDESVSGVNVARSGMVWITTRVGMCQFVNGHMVPYLFQTESQGRRPEYLGAYEDHRGNIWAFGDTYLINLAEGKRFNYFRSSESASIRIWSLCEGRGGRLWIGTSGRGLFCFEDNRFQPVILSENRWPYDVRAICEDREGNLWLGTSGGGLVQLRLQSVQVLRVEQGLPDSLPTTLALDASGRIYVGLQRGGLWLGESGRFDQIGTGGGLQLQNFISSACVARDGTVWAGTLGDGLYGLRSDHGIHYTTADGLANNTISALAIDSEDSVWASTTAGTVHRFGRNGVTRFDAQQGMPTAPVTVMTPATAGGLWLGTQAGQVLQENHGKFALMQGKGADALINHPVLALYESEPGRLWVGTADTGLTCVTNGVGINWNTNNGLPAAAVAGVAEDGAKNLWLATSTGIYRISRLDVQRALDNPSAPLACKLVSPVKTMPESAAVLGGTHVVLAPDGHLWFATSEGVLNVDTHQAEIGPSLFPVYLESVAVNTQPPISLLTGESWSTPGAVDAPLTVPLDLRSMEIHFTALSFTAPEDIQFRHRLDGFDPDWVEDGAARFARYGRLPYGAYRFHVAARNSDGNWQEAKTTLALIVPTPVYFQSWAICVYIFSAVALVTGIVRVISHRRLRVTLASLEQQQSLERERMRIARDMHDEMGSKLTKMSFLSEHAQLDVEPTGPLADKIQSIAQTSRELLKTMDEIVWVVNPRNDTLENLIAYLSHYAVEYFQNTTVECEMRLPPEIPHYALSSEDRHNLFLTFEETLNNVLKHSDAKIVKVEMTVNPSEFELKVTDDGKGFEAVKQLWMNLPARGRGGNGLKNMRQRLTTIGGACLISSQPGAGTVVTIHIPLNPKNSK